MFDTALIQVASYAFLDVVWPVLHPDVLDALSYV